MHKYEHLNYFVWISGLRGPEAVRVDEDGLDLIKKHKREILQKQTLKTDELDKNLNFLIERYPEP